MISIVRNYNNVKSPISHKYLTHGKRVPTRKCFKFNCSPDPFFCQLKKSTNYKVSTTIRTYCTKPFNNDDSIPAKVYEDAYSMKKGILFFFFILKKKFENIGKSGIYMLTNKLTGDIYVGQSMGISSSSADEIKEKDFYEWFCGLTDGEGSFVISRMKNSFWFSFDICLHIDDTEMLNFIQKRLGVGKVYTSGKLSRLRVTNQKDVKKILEIFSKYPLNTTKYLNYLDFKKAFELYVSSNGKTVEIIQEIEKIKSGVNSLRSDFKTPESRKFSITPN